LAQLQHRREKCRTAAFPKFFMFIEAERRNTGFPYYNVTPLSKNHHFTFFTTGFRRLTEGRHEAFCFEAFCFGAFGWGRLSDFWFLAFDFWNEGRPLEGKRIAEGKMNC
jgi:hypothetical protein